MSAEYRFHGKLTFEEYLQVHRILTAKRRIIVRGLVILLGAIYIIMGVAGNPANTLLMGVGILAIASALLLSPIQFRYRVKRLWQRNPSIQKGMDVTLVEDGLRITDDKGQPFHKDWSGFHQFRETSAFFLLYLSPIQPLCLPKRLIPREDLPAVRSMLAAAGKKLPPSP